MLSIFLIIKKIFNFLNANESVENLSLSLTISFIFSLIPFNIIIHPLLIISLILFNGNLLVFLFVTPFLSLITPVSYEELHVIGNSILTIESAQELFNLISTFPIITFTNWNNTVTLGAYFVSIILFIPLFYIYSFFIKMYRNTILKSIENSKFLKIYKKLNWLTILGKGK